MTNFAQELASAVADGAELRHACNATRPTRGATVGSSGLRSTPVAPVAAAVPTDAGIPAAEDAAMIKRTLLAIALLGAIAACNTPASSSPTTPALETQPPAVESPSMPATSPEMESTSPSSS